MQQLSERFHAGVWNLAGEHYARPHVPPPPLGSVLSVVISANTKPKLQFFASDPAAQLSAAPASACGRRADPLWRDPLDLGTVDPLEVCLQLSERRRDVSVDDHLVEQVPTLVLHGFSHIDHVLEVLLLPPGHTRSVKMQPPCSFTSFFHGTWRKLGGTCTPSRREARNQTKNLLARMWHAVKPLFHTNSSRLEARSSERLVESQLWCWTHSSRTGTQMCDLAALIRAGGFKR